MNVSSWSIRNPIPAVLLFVLLTLAGLLGFRAMKMQNFPDIDLPTVIVTAAARRRAGAAGNRGGAQDRELGRHAAGRQAHLHQGAGRRGHVTVEFRLEKPTQEALDDVRDAVSRVRADLPADLRDPVITKIDLAGSPILTYTVASSRMDDEALSWFVDNEVTKACWRARRRRGHRVGGVTREVRVELDPARLLALNATAADISRQLRQVQQELPGGRADVGGAEQSVRTIATVQSAAEELAGWNGAVRRPPHPPRPGGHGQRHRGRARSGALLDGKPVVGFEIVRSRGAGESTWPTACAPRWPSCAPKHPDVRHRGLQLRRPGGGELRRLDVPAATKARRWRCWWSGCSCATGAPPGGGHGAAAVGDPGLRRDALLFGFTINVVTLLSLSLVVGILVDDAIVEIENIMRHLRMGKTPYQAAMEAADEIGLAVIATTFTLIAVFLPTAFMSGVPGKFFVQFGWTAAIAVFFSLVVARMLTPMMAAYILKPAKTAHHEPRLADAVSTWAGRWCLKHRVLTLLARRCSSSAPSCWCRCCPPASSRPTT
jgi:Cu/Ag efflux pump CusA